MSEASDQSSYLQETTQLPISCNNQLLWLPEPRRILRRRFRYPIPLVFPCGFVCLTAKGPSVRAPSRPRPFSLQKVCCREYFFHTRRYANILFTSPIPRVSSSPSLPSTIPIGPLAGKVVVVTGRYSWTRAVTL